MAKQGKTWTYPEFLSAAAKALWDIQQAKRIKSRANDVLSMLGVTIPDGATDGTAPEFEFTNAVEPQDTYIGAGMTLADLSPEAKAKREAKRVQGLRNDVYQHMRNLTTGYSECGRSNCPNHPVAQADTASVVRHFAALDFPQPTQTTTIHAYVRQGDNVRYINAKVNGTITEAEAKAKLEPLGSHSPEHLATVAAFGEDSHSEQLVEELRVRTSTDWAVSPDA